MKHSLSLIFFLFILSTVSAQKSDLKTWAVMKDLIGMETAAAETLIKSHGYNYDRSFEGLGVQFKEYGGGIKNYFYDLLVLGSRIDKIHFIKLEFIEKGYAEFEKSIIAAGYNKDALNERHLVGKIAGAYEGYYNSNSSNLKIRYELEDKGQGKKGTVYIYINDIPLFFCYEENMKAVFCIDCVLRRLRFDDEGFQTEIYNEGLMKMSCLPVDSEYEDSAVGQKIKLLWNLYHNKFQCNVPGYDLEGNSVLAYAVRTNYVNFLYRVFKTYNLDPNIKFYREGKMMTVLDFTHSEIDRINTEIPSSTQRIKVIEDIAKMLRNFGAKTITEINLKQN